jgi:hypothetical protein
VVTEEAALKCSLAGVIYETYQARWEAELVAGEEALVARVNEYDPLGAVFDEAMRLAHEELVDEPGDLAPGAQQAQLEDEMARADLAWEAQGASDHVGEGDIFDGTDVAVGRNDPGALASVLDVFREDQRPKIASLNSGQSRIFSEVCL